jgi:hypothetical protein
MFVRLDGGSDGNQAGRKTPSRHDALDSARSGRPPSGRIQEPIEDQTSSFVRTRSMTADVNSVVPAWPPRSGVLVPEATVSSVPS